MSGGTEGWRPAWMETGMDEWASVWVSGSTEKKADNSVKWR